MRVNPVWLVNATVCWGTAEHQLWLQDLGEAKVGGEGASWRCVRTETEKGMKQSWTPGEGGDGGWGGVLRKDASVLLFLLGNRLDGMANRQALFFLRGIFKP